MTSHATVPSTSTGDPAGPVPLGQRPPVDWVGWIARLGVIFALVGCVIFFSLQKAQFHTTKNMQTTLEGAAPLLIMALGLTVVLVMGDFDLSVASMLAVGSATIVSLIVRHDVSWGLAIAVGALVAIAVGMLNGFLIAYVGTPSFITTLAMGVVLTGVEVAISGASTQFISGAEKTPKAYRNLGVGEPFLSLRSPVWIALGLTIILWALLAKTEVGRFMYAIGGNPEAARLSGIRTRMLRASGFVVVALCALTAAVTESARTASHVRGNGASLLLPAFAAAFLGATLSKRGQFNILGTVFGAIFLQVVESGLTFMGYEQDVKNIVKGTILIAAMLLNRLGTKRR